MAAELERSESLAGKVDGGSSADNSTESRPSIIRVFVPIYSNEHMHTRFSVMKILLMRKVER